MRLSKLLAAEIENGEKSGYVFCVNENYDGELSLACADENEEEFTVPFDNIRSVKEKIIFSKTSEESGFSKPLRLGKPVFDCEGNFIGKLYDIIIEKGRISAVIAGNRKFSASDVVSGDAVLIKNNICFLKSDVRKNGKTIIRKGTPLTDEIAEKAQKSGEYVQTKLKSL